MTSVPSLNQIGRKLAKLAHREIFGWLAGKFGFKAQSHYVSLPPKSTLQVHHCTVQLSPTIYFAGPPPLIGLHHPSPMSVHASPWSIEWHTGPANKQKPQENGENPLKMADNTTCRSGSKIICYEGVIFSAN